MKENFAKCDNYEAEIETEISSELLQRVRSMAKSLNISLNDFCCAALDEFVAKHNKNQDSNVEQGEL